MTAPSPSGAAGGLVLTGVTMELAGARGPATVVAGVTLALGPEGITATPPSGLPVALSWPSIGWARCGEGGLLADGAPAVAVAATVAGHLVRWLVPEDQMPEPRALAIDHLLTARTGTDAATAPESAEVDHPTGGPAAAAAFPRGGPAAAAALPRGGPAAAAALPRGGPAAAASGPPAARSGAASGSGAADPLRLLLPPTPSPASTAGRNRGGGGPLGIVVAWLAIAALVLVGAGLLVASSIRVPPSGSPSGPSGQHLAQARTMARTVSLRLADLPAGWTSVTTASGPLSGFVRSGASVTASPPGSAEAARRYARCLGVRTAAVPLVAVGATPLASSTSGAFAGPSTGAPMQVASVTAVYATPAPVRQTVAQLQRHGFAACFGAAVGAELARSLAAQAPAGVTTGTASTQQLPLPRWAGIRATGVDLKIPLDVRGDATSVQLGFAFVTGRRVEATLVTFSTTGVPESLARTLAATLEEEVAAAGGR